MLAGPCPSKGSGRISPQLLQLLGASGVLACGLISPVSATTFSQPMCLLFFSYKDTTNHWTSDSILTQVDFILGSLTACMFPKKVVLQAPRWT